VPVSTDTLKEKSLFETIKKEEPVSSDIPKDKSLIDLIKKDVP